MRAASLSAPPVGLTMPVERLIRRPAVFVNATLSLRQVAAVLDDETIGVVLVRARGALAGLVSERDVAKALADGADPDSDRAGDVMTDHLETVAAGTPLAEVARLMLTDEIRHVPVVEGTVVMGVVSIRDVLAVLLTEAEETSRGGGRR